MCGLAALPLLWSPVAGGWRQRPSETLTPPRHARCLVVARRAAVATAAVIPAANSLPHRPLARPPTRVPADALNTPEASRGVDRHAQDQFSDFVVARRAAAASAVATLAARQLVCLPSRSTAPLASSPTRPPSARSHPSPTQSHARPGEGCLANTPMKQLKKIGSLGTL